MTTSIASRFCRKLVMPFRRASAATSPKPWFLKTRQRSSLAFHFPLLGKPRETHLNNSSARLAGLLWQLSSCMLMARLGAETDRYSLLVRLFHPLLHAGLPRRTV